MKLNEILYSIQGESHYAGRPCTLVRLSGCNLRCSYCDTQYAYDEGEEKTIETIVSAVESLRCRLVEVTGGEPLLQEECPDLVQAFLDKGYTVLVETNGSLDIRRLPAQAICIMDLKCPSSGMSERMHLGNLDSLREKDEVKFVIQDYKDYAWATRILEQFPHRLWKVSFSPIHGVLSLERLASWILDDRMDVRLQPQLHKYIWPNAPL
jgi:7-carboxy-7-deazaguanine synthase